MGSNVSVPEPAEIPLEQRKLCLPGTSPDLDGVVQLLRGAAGRKPITKIACLCGAGISVSAGIPDFRTPGTGLYSQLEAYGLPTPESMFDLAFFKDNPTPFCTLAKALFPGQYEPTMTHAFLKVLQDKGLLQRCYTQNIDTLERVVGIEPSRLVEAHGSFASVVCVGCRGRAALQGYRDEIDQGTVPRCTRVLDVAPPELPPSAVQIEAAKAELKAAVEAKSGTSITAAMSEYLNRAVAVKKAEGKVAELEAAAEAYPGKFAAWKAAPKTKTCGGLLKPSIVFFGEPTATKDAADDLANAELLIILGTSLQVMPFAGLIGHAPALCPRLLINREFVGGYDQEDPPLGFGNVGLRWGRDDNYRDVFMQSDCDAAVEQICSALGWEKELEATLAAARAIPPGDAWLSLVREDDRARASLGTVAQQATAKP